MAGTELTQDQKGSGSLTLGEVIPLTRHNFPDSRFHPTIDQESEYYHLYGIDPSQNNFGINTGKHLLRKTRRVWVTADGIGTKPELAERLYTDTNDPSYFETLPTDAYAMIDGDEARFGRFMVGVAQIFDMNTADQRVVSALAKGSRAGCDNGKFALLNGELAELGYRMSGYGPTRVNIGAFGLSVVVQDKLILGHDLKPGQIIVGLQEDSLRSNGFTRGRGIPEAAYLYKQGYRSKEEYIASELGISPQKISEFMGHNFTEQVLPPWHRDFPELTRELLKPSTLYGKFINSAQNGVDGEKDIKIVAAAHVSGGGIPEKVKRMVQPKGLGAHIEPVFPDPNSVSMLMELAQTLPEEMANNLINDRVACEQWNRGIGFLVVVEDASDAAKLFMLGQRFNIPALQVGEIIEDKKIEWRGHAWTY